MDISQERWAALHEALKLAYQNAIAMHKETEKQNLPQAFALGEIANQSLSALQDFEQNFWAYKE